MSRPRNFIRSCCNPDARIGWIWPPSTPAAARPAAALDEKTLEPISKLLRRVANGPELYKPEEVGWLIFPAHQ